MQDGPASIEDGADAASDLKVIRFDESLACEYLVTSSRFDVAPAPNVQAIQERLLSLRERNNLRGCRFVKAGNVQRQIHQDPGRNCSYSRNGTNPIPDRQAAT